MKLFRYSRYKKALVTALLNVHNLSRNHQLPWDYFLPCTPFVLLCTFSLFPQTNSNLHSLQPTKEPLPLLPNCNPNPSTSTRTNETPDLLLFESNQRNPPHSRLEQGPARSRASPCGRGHGAAGAVHHTSRDAQPADFCRTARPNGSRAWVSTSRSAPDPVCRVDLSPPSPLPLLWRRWQCCRSRDPLR